MHAQHYKSRFENTGEEKTILLDRIVSNEQFEIDLSLQIVPIEY